MAEKKVNFLSQSANGYVKQCDCCQKIGIGFKNIYIPLKKSDFLVFKDYINELNQTSSAIETDAKSHVNLAFADVVIRLEAMEFRQLYTLVVAAETELFRQQLELIYQGSTF